MRWCGGARAGYYALISYFDEKIGELLDTLSATGQYENTVIIHLSDHGEMNGEHGMWRKFELLRGVGACAAAGGVGGAD